ncbi:sensor histidine kinase [Frankia canadensis]|uniref:sensor histidine kinase n=1 Tax=Frankia canadensis TaxID=1836972 RepID=UPI001A9C4AE3|nr:sensor histidine kinase [Frankia canadensis]
MKGRWFGWLRTAIDVVLPAAMALFLLAALSDPSVTTSRSLVLWLGVPAAVIQGVALYWRRARPVPVVAITLAGGLALHVVAPDLVIPFAGLVAVCSLAAARPPTISVPALLALVGLAAANFRTAPAGDAYFTMAMAVVAWALGEIMRNRRVAIEEESRRAVMEERARIARELHDVIAHSVSVIVVQAAAGDDVFESRPDQARQALRSIEAAGRDALAELRRLLGAVRPDDGQPTRALGPGAVGSGTDEANRPQPGLARIDELAGPLRAAGLDVCISRVGRVRPLAAGVDVSAYRIVQEALTNTVRHARATRVGVTITYSADAVGIDIVDDGQGTGPGGPASVLTDAAPGEGHGILGMRERANLLGGQLWAGPIRAGGFQVRADLPAPPRMTTGAGR